MILSEDLGLNYLGDELRLSQVITNLLSNALEFTPEGGTITLTVEKIGQHENLGKLCFSVADTGIGMTSEQVSRLWGAFEQADGSASRKYGGTGLGPTISQSIVDKMGGQIWVESELGVGSTFRFEISLGRASHQELAIFDRIRPEEIKLLMIESNDDIRKRFLRIVTNFGMSADAVKDVAEALALVDSAHNTNRAYDIIFADYHLLGTNGLVTAKQLDGRIDKNAVIIITTSLEWNQIKSHALQNNITRHITKPLFPSSILDAINEVIGTGLKTLHIEADNVQEVPDFSGVPIILTGDVEINREIALALLEPTNLIIDCAANGAEAVNLFFANPTK